MRQIILFIFFYATSVFGQTLDTIRKIEISYGYGSQCFPRDGVYAKSENFIFEKSAKGTFELAKYNKFWRIAKQDAAVFESDSSETNLNKRCDSKILLDLLKNLNSDQKNFSFSFLKSKIDSPSSHRIKKIAKKIDRFFMIACDGLFDCEFRNQIIDSIQKFKRFDEFVSSMNLTKNQMVIIGYSEFARVRVTSQSTITYYDFSFVNNSIGQPILKNYNSNYMTNSSYVNLKANEIIRELIPKNSMTYKAFDLKNITEAYIRWDLNN